MQRVTGRALETIYGTVGILCSQHFQDLYKWSLGKTDFMGEKYILYLEVFLHVLQEALGGMGATRGRLSHFGKSQYIRLPLM